MNKQNGFTLLELIIVITVIGILIGVVLPKVTNVTDTANKSTVLSDTNALQSAILMAYGQGQVHKSKFITIDDENLILNEKGYPYRLTSGNPVVNPENCKAVFELLLRITSENKYDVKVDNQDCIYYYETNEIIYNTTKGSVTYHET